MGTLSRFGLVGSVLLGFWLLCSPARCQDVSSPGRVVVIVPDQALARGFSEDTLPDEWLVRQEQLQADYPDLFPTLSFQRIFPPAGKHEARHIAFGLHRWYYLEGKGGYALQQAQVDALQATGWFESVQWEPLPQPNAETTSSILTDSLLSRQWHVYNTGQTGGRPGADIRLINAQALEAGRPEVIISIHDSGIDSLHPEVLENLWVNPGEIPDNGIDDDDNGYIDDVHGWNFALRNNDLQDRAGHGTFIAGLIGAKADERGMRGVAGGDAPDNGVRLMICRLDNDYEDLNVINPEASIVYAADNGSVISTNSWNTFGYSSSVLTALAYYQTHASGPLLDGGLVVFSAGNNGSGYRRYEKDNPIVMMVGALDHTDQLSYFSNYGSWLDLAAPGEDLWSHDIQGGFGKASGTSFSAPLVAAVASLVVSKFGHANYPVDSLILRINESADSIDQYQNFFFQGKVGAGRLNAFEALLSVDSLPPDPVTDFWVDSVAAYQARLALVAPEDETLAPFSYHVGLQSTGGSWTWVSDSVVFPRAQDTVGIWLDSLVPDTEYALRLVALDYFGHASDTSSTLTFNTTGAPEAYWEGFPAEIRVAQGATEPYTWTLANLGESPLTWRVTDRVPTDTALVGIEVRFTSPYYAEIGGILADQGAQVKVLDTLAFAHQLQGVHLLFLDDLVANLNGDQRAMLRQWVRQGGKLILGLDSRGALDSANALVEELGIQYQAYESAQYTTFEDIFSTEPLLTDVYSLYLYYYQAYLTLDETSQARVVLHDGMDNPYLAWSPWGKGEVVIGANQFFQNFQLDVHSNLTLVQNMVDALAETTRSTVSPSQGELAGGESVSLQAAFSHNLGPQHGDTLWLHTNEAYGTWHALPYQLQVAGQGQLVASPKIPTFDSTYMGYARSQRLLLLNGGTDTLTLEVPSTEQFVTDLAGSTHRLAPGDSLFVQLSFVPQIHGLAQDTLRWATETDTLTMPLAALGLDPPQFYFPLSDTVYLTSADTLRQASVVNEGGIQPLRYQLRVVETPASRAAAPAHTPQFTGKVFGVMGYNFVSGNLERLPEYAENTWLSMRAPLINNDFTLDTLDALLMDERYIYLTLANLEEIKAWVNDGGSLMFQTDLYYDQNKLDLLLELVPGTRMIRRGKTYSDTLREVSFHNATRGVSRIYARGYSAYIETPDPGQVLIRDALGQPHLTAHTVGKGRVMLCSNEFLYGSFFDPQYLRLASQSLAWLVNGEDSPVTLTQGSAAELYAGEHQPVEFTVAATASPPWEASLTFTTQGPDTVVTRTLVMGEAPPTNQPPQGTSWTYTLAENPVWGLGLGPTQVTDPDGHPLRWYWPDDSPLSYVDSLDELVVTSPSFFDYEQRTVWATTVEVSDGQDTLLVDVQINITDVNEPPTWSSVEGDTLFSEEDQGLTMVWQPTDPEGDSLTLAISSNAPGFEASPTDEAWSFTMPPNQSGLVWVHRLATDGEHTVVDSLPWQIQEVNDLPEVQPDTLVVAENQPQGAALGELAITDPDHEVFSVWTAANAALGIEEGTRLIVQDSGQLDYESSPHLAQQIWVSDGVDTVAHTLVLTLTDEPETVTGLENAAPWVQLGPNTSRQQINLRFAMAVEEAQLFLYDSQGQLMNRTEQTRLLTGTFAWPQPRLSPGYYWLQIITQDQRTVIPLFLP